MKHKKAYKAIKALKKKLAIEKELFRILMTKYGQLLKGAK